MFNCSDPPRCYLYYVNGVKSKLLRPLLALYHESKSPVQITGTLIRMTYLSSFFPSSCVASNWFPLFHPSLHVVIYCLLRRQSAESDLVPLCSSTVEICVVRVDTLRVGFFIYSVQIFASYSSNYWKKFRQKEIRTIRINYHSSQDTVLVFNAFNHKDGCIWLYMSSLCI